ncbi:type VI secretion system-associated protein TagF, partial [Acidimicrobium ferrooxidans]|nr:type VI secretion system-associated protein TagF [Acidimicrobium ferrooxidans]
TRLESEQQLLGEIQAGQGQAQEEASDARQQVAELQSEIAAREVVLDRIEGQLGDTGQALERSQAVLEQARSEELAAQSNIERMADQVETMSGELAQMDRRREAQQANPQGTLTRRVGALVGRLGEQGSRLVGMASGRLFNLQVGCYGKLPIETEFIKHRADQPELALLDRWFQEGIWSASQRVGQQWDQTFDAQPPVRIFYQPPTTSRLLIGALRASADRVGRRYPFLICTTLEARAPGPARDVPGYFEAFLDEALETATDGWQEAALPGLRQRVEELGFSLQAGELTQQVNQHLSGKTAGELFADQTLAPRVLQNLLALEPGKQPELALRFPPTHCAADLAFWLGLTGRLLGRAMPTLMLWHYPGGPTDAVLTCHYGALVPEDYLALFWPQYRSDRVLDLAAASPDDQLRQDRIASLMTSPLDELIVQLHRLHTQG